MPLFAPRPVLQEAVIERPAQDLKTAQKLGQYRLGRQALFLPAFPSWEYLPLALLQKAYMRTRNIATNGCCGLVLTCPVVVVTYPGGQKVLEADSPRQADEFLKTLARRLPGLDTRPPAVCPPAP